MKTAFVATVGVGTGPEADITRPLVESIRQANPDRLVLFASVESQPNADKTLRDLGRTPENTVVHVLQAPKEDVEQLYQEMLDRLRGLICDGFLPLQITADFTTGTKPMSAALVLAASHLGLGNLKYTAVRRDEQRRVCLGTERMLTFRPAGLFASRALKHAFDDVEGYRFAPALLMLESLPDELLSKSEKEMRDSLDAVARAYSAWDLFQHNRFASLHARAAFRADPSLARFRARPETVQVVDDVGRAARERRMIDLAVADLVNNARRRIEEGKFDDATARLYRACEMLAQWQLSTKGIVTGDVDLTKVPLESKAWLERCRSGPRHEIQVGLHKSYQLLAEMDDELGKAFAGDDTLRAVLRDRNNSILAHGTKPVAREACEKLLNCVEGLAKTAVTDYDRKSALLRFPWSR